LGSTGHSGPRPIADVIRQFLAESRLGRSTGDERVYRAWSEAAGAAWCEHARPSAFRGGQLFVEVTSSVHLAELRGFHAEGIRARANQALGQERIRKVVLRLKG
jgi:hypothetical protein